MSQEEAAEETAALKVVETADAPAALEPAAEAPAALEPAAHDPIAQESAEAMPEPQKPVIHIVPPPPTPEESSIPSAVAEARSDEASMTQAPMTQASVTPASMTPASDSTPAPSMTLASETSAPRPAAGGVHPFAPPPTSMGSVAQTKSPLGAPKEDKPKAAEKGFFGRLKEKLMSVADEDSHKEHIPARRSAPASVTPAMPAPATPAKSSPSNLVPPHADAETDDEDQLEIPNFLKGQVN